MAIHPSLLLQFSLLKNLPPTLLPEVAAASSLKTFAKREVVLNKGAASVQLCFLLEGRLQATDFTLDGKEVGLYFVDEGGYFGEIAMLDGLAQPEIMIANKKSQVVLIPNSVIRGLILSHPAMTEAITTGLAKRIRAQSEQRQILSINNPMQRVCSQILSMQQPARQSDVSASVEWALADPPTHQELAMMVNLSRETVTRVFQILQSQSLVLREKDALIVSKPDVLQQVAKGLLDLTK
ncbi:Crp/Fnr family transcriptional regulator [Limnohabitans sp. 2KL-3]|jgi:CRP-like cAMP-binding protein|uniref:Crp/Fnr family transcriptional regulator n=1 Tax=Limnohabitans sp. 2KL-3 TaxID=1100700 RepID=UPI000A5B283B|nr:Crp/Fnr family transcriptional regulator [Limnohabitans sp. 2KL-3]